MGRLPDYLADPRLGRLPFMRLKKFVASAASDRSSVEQAMTKFALVNVAEREKIQLDGLLDSVARDGQGDDESTRPPAAATPLPLTPAPPPPCT